MTVMMLSSCGGRASTEGVVSTEEGSSNEITIGEQVWMAKNLNVDTFRNGDPIPEAKTDKEWEEAGKNGKPAWCFYDNDPVNGDRYGKLYNCYAVNDARGLAPEGWKIPSEEDWFRLTDYLGGGKVAGSKLKSTDFCDDNDGESDNSTNECGFSGLLGGFRNYVGTFLHFGKYGYWWSSPKDPSYLDWFVILDYNDGGLSGGGNSKGGGGFSVRCLRD